MKMIILSILLILSFSSIASEKIDYPIAAARLSLSGSVMVIYFCDTKSVIAYNSSSEIFSRHARSKVHAFCYGKYGIHNVNYIFERGRSDIVNMIARQPSRFYF